MVVSFSFLLFLLHCLLRIKIYNIPESLHSFRLLGVELQGRTHDGCRAVLNAVSLGGGAYSNYIFVIN